MRKRRASSNCVTGTSKNTIATLRMFAWLVPSLVGDALAMIYLEDVSGALSYDRSGDAAIPQHYLTHTSLNESTSVSSIAPSQTTTASGGRPSQTHGNSTIFSRGLVGSNATAQGSFNNSNVDSERQFDDLLLINSSLDYVYYDSKQARFGADLGPPGNFQMVNLLLPPRGLWGGQLLQSRDQPNAQRGENSQQTHLDPASTASQSSTNHTLRGYRFLQHTKSTESIDQFLGLAEPTTYNHNVNDTAVLVNQTLVVEDQQQPLFVDGMFHQQEEQSFVHKNNSKTDAQQNINSTNGTITINISSHDSSATSSPIAASNIDNITNSWDQSLYISDYFCLEDFVEWRTQRTKCDSQNPECNTQQQQQNSLLKVRVDSNETSRNDTDDDATSFNESPSQTLTPPCLVNDSSILQDNVTNSSFSFNTTRPLTILVRRGRCSFESKAQMAMLLNEMFIADGKSNRISHVIIYNNETVVVNNSIHDNNDQDEEKLIEMGLISQTTWKGNEEDWLSHDGRDEIRYEIGMLYITSRSGHDLIQRMKERERRTGVHPYLDVSRLFLENVSGNRRQLQKSIQENGEYNDNILTDKQTTHDPLLTNGWFFPATLTRFCLSCGPVRNYGFDILPNPSENITNGHYEGWINRWGPSQTHGSNVNTQYIPEEWVDAVRKLMISVLAVLLIGPFLFAVWRWHTVGGTVRITTDENGTRRLRLITPNLEVFVNGAPGAVEENGTKLDRAQVFALPEMEFVSVVGEEGIEETSAILREIDGNYSFLPERESEHAAVSVDTARFSQEPTALDPSPLSPPSVLDDCLETGLFVSSTCCSICLDEFVHGERVRILPRCHHAFHTGCILPWLTERQGCCPLCKTKVLPDEFQRRRTRQPTSSPRNRIIRSLRDRVYQPQSSPVQVRNDVPVAGVQVAVDLRNDLRVSQEPSSLDGDILEHSLHLDLQQFPVNDDPSLSDEELDAGANSCATQNVSATEHNESHLRQTAAVTIDNVVGTSMEFPASQFSSTITNEDATFSCVEEGFVATDPC